MYKDIKEKSLKSVTVSKFNEGDGSIDNHYIIRNEHDIEAVSEMIQARYTLKDVYFIVADDVDYIDLTKLDNMYIPIGNNSIRFEGYFDGNETVFKLDIDRTGTSYQGLFGVIGVNATVKSLGVEGNVIGYDFVGGIVGRNYGKLLNVYNKANILATRQYAGGDRKST